MTSAKPAFLLPAFALLAASCSMQPTTNNLTGFWTQPIPGQSDQLQGMELMPGGKARSINMHTLLYKSWQLDGNRLTLTGRSIGNKTSSTFTTTATIDSISKKSLILNIDGRKETYTLTPPWLCGKQIQSF